MRRTAAILAALLLLAVATAAPVQAAGVRRVFTAAMGTGGGSGTIRITYRTDGTGRVDYNLKGLRAGATYRVDVHRRTCANLGTVAARLTSVRATSQGTVAYGREIGYTNINNIWSANWSYPLSVRLVSGSSIKCGNLLFPRATRVQVPSYNINLAVVRGPNGYPYCNVAMYMGALNQPQEPGVSFIFAHARTGMFLPLLNASKINDGAAMVGKKVYVWTSNSKLHTYQITQVRRHVKSVQNAVGLQAEQLWLQTSEGPNFTYPKLVIVTKRLSTVSTTYAASHPAARIVHCG
jgi:sortase family protein